MVVGSNPTVCTSTKTRAKRAGTERENTLCVSDTLSHLRISCDDDTSTFTRGFDEIIVSPRLVRLKSHSYSEREIHIHLFYNEC
jgi:hypothetical protein